jgi:hypothetical protein
MLKSHLVHSKLVHARLAPSGTEPHNKGGKHLVRGATADDEPDAAATRGRGFEVVDEVTGVAESSSESIIFNRSSSWPTDLCDDLPLALLTGAE